MWLTLFPLKVGGLLGTVPDTNTLRNAWTIGNSSSLGLTPTGRRWSSIRTVLNPSGDDLSRIENIEFLGARSTRPTANRALNPTLVLDFGDISENRVAFAPETLTVTAPAGAGLKPDTTYRGKRLAGYDRFDSERDRFSRAFNARGQRYRHCRQRRGQHLGGGPNGTNRRLSFRREKVPICRADLRQFKVLGRQSRQLHGAQQSTG